MKKINVTVSLLLGILLTGSSCMLPLASKNFQAYEPNSKGDRVKHAKKGSLLILNVLPTGKSVDIKDELSRMKESYQCSTLKNIDTQFFNYSFYIVGWEKLVITADCEK